MPIPAAVIPIAAGLLGGIFGGKKQKQTSKNIDQYAAQARTRYDPYIQSYTGSLDDAQQRQAGLFNQIQQGYSSLFGQQAPGVEGIGQDVNALREYGRNPISAADMARARGGGNYEEFAQTGGYSPEDIRRITSANDAITPSFFSSLSGMLNRQRTLSGGNPGFTQQQIALSRQGARAAQDAHLQGQMALSDAVRQGRQWGTQGMSDSELNLQNLIGRQKLGAMEGALRGSMGIGQLEQGQQADALRGLQQLYQSQPGESRMYNDYIMNLLGMGSQDEGNALRLQAGYNPNEGDFFSRFARYAGPAASMFGGQNATSGQGSAVRYLPDMAGSGQYQQGNYLGNLPVMQKQPYPGGL
jgi:hypothetical protein